MLTSMTGHDCVLLRADDPLIDMNYITSFTGMTDKWFYKLRWSVRSKMERNGAEWRCYCHIQICNKYK